jgi:putative colanic acid biosynthesis acetyltransferase WcaF
MNAFLCTGSHDVSHPEMRLTHAPIFVRDGAWICARAFLGPGVVVGEGAVVAACAVVTKNVDAWTVVAGNPAIVKKERKLDAGNN